MEVKEVGKRVAITKPIDSKPGFTKFKSLSELLAGANNNVCTQTARVIKPIVNRPSVATLFSQGEASGRTTPMPETKPLVIYKPLAKVVSKATLSFLANMGSHTTTHYQVQSPTQHVNHSTPTSSTKSTSVVVGREVEKVTNPTLEPKPFVTSANVDRPSYDGYNWRKYGQKQVKGSDFPRSYYKCTHPNCLVKKKVERSFDGQIAEIVYKGDHNHTKPLPPKNYQDLDNSKSSNNNASQGVFENHGEVVVELPNQTTYLKILQQLSHNRASVSKEIEVDIDEEPKSKRRKSGIQSNNSAMLEEGSIQQPRILVQNATENEILGDGFRWRKYGQKIVKGNTYPRSYYKCTSLKCNVRKHVERASDDPKAFITTYEGKHNHHMPLID